MPIVSTRTLVLAALLLPLLPAGEAAAQPTCPARPAVQVQVTVDDPPPRIVRNVNLQQLRTYEGTTTPNEAHRLGVTIVRLEWRSEVMPVLEVGPAGVCALPARVTVSILNVDHRIVIASDIPNGSCLYEEVEAHERRHAEVNRRNLREVVPAVKRALDAWARSAEGRGATPEAAMAMLQDGMRRALEPPIEAMRATRAAQQAAIDSPEEYRRLTQVCGRDQVRLQDRLRNP